MYLTILKVEGKKKKNMLKLPGPGRYRTSLHHLEQKASVSTAYICSADCRKSFGKLQSCIQTAHYLYNMGLLSYASVSGPRQEAPSSAHLGVAGTPHVAAAVAPQIKEDS